MQSNEAIKKISRCAQLYNQYLCNRNYMVVFDLKAGSGFDFIDLLFTPRNFLHLTGAKTQMSAIQFYKAAVDSRLKATDITLPANGICEQKLAVLPELTAMHRSCKMIGEFNNNGFFLETSHVMGNIRGAMGFIKSTQNSQFYAPNTVLKGDIRERAISTYRIAAMIRKRLKDSHYSRLCYLANGIAVNNIEHYLRKTGKLISDLVQEEI